MKSLKLLAFIIIIAIITIVAYSIINPKIREKKYNDCIKACNESFLNNVNGVYFSNGKEKECIQNICIKKYK